MTIAATPLSIGFEECGLEALKELAGLKLRLFARPCLRAVSEAYDAQNDFLTQVDYNDGQANEVQNWDYDAAGNRGSYISNIPGAQWTYDNLNRIVTSPIGSYAHDMAGNRLTGPGQTLSWDVTNRLTGLNGVTHRYRNDGMRVQKVAANGDTYRWHYDAQMPVEETRVVGGQTTVMRNIVGPRGIDIQFDGSNAAFPLYDTHGNAKALLARSGSTFTTTAWRQYDVWGSLRTGSALGGASQRYCANLGHVTDDESGLVYMRARFYEPWTGRFVSQDPAMDGKNWYLYANDNPVSYVDVTGRYSIHAQAGDALGLWALGAGLLFFALTSPDPILSAGAFILAAFAFSESTNVAPSGALERNFQEFNKWGKVGVELSFLTAVGLALKNSSNQAKAAGAAAAAVMALVVYAVMCLAEVIYGLNVANASG